MERSTQDVTFEEVRTVIKNLLVDEFDVEPELITDSATLEALDLDSLDLVDIGQVVEHEFGVRIRARDAQGISDFASVIAMIHRRVTMGDDTAAEPAGVEDSEAAPQASGAA